MEYSDISIKLFQQFHNFSPLVRMAVILLKIPKNSYK